MRASPCLFFVVAGVLLLNPVFAAAQSASNTPIVAMPRVISDEDFNPNYIISDDDMFELGSMNEQRIQSFLEARGSLGSYKTKDIDGIEKLVSKIIWRVATSYKMNPKYLLVLLQKEQSLVEASKPTQRAFDWATGFGVCDACGKDDPAIQAYKGFANQLEYAAKQHRERYLFQILTKGKTLSGYAPGKEFTISGKKVTPANNATAMLYTYTPHIHGNLNLWRIWQRWFSMSFPEGTLVQAKNSKKFYLIRLGTKRPFQSKAVMASMMNPDKVVVVDDTQLTGYPDGKPISFPNFSIVESSEGKRYLISGDKKRFIVSQKVFQKLGFIVDDELSPEDDELLEAYADGPDITEKSANALGKLFKDSKGGVWYVEDSVRQAVPNQALVKLYFNNRPVKAITDKLLATYATGTPMMLASGELVKSDAKGDSSIYVIENGMRRPIPSGEVFEALGWKWKNIVTLSDKYLKTYPIGDPVDMYQRRALDETLATNH